jgi:hypothetical protein
MLNRAWILCLICAASGLPTASVNAADFIVAPAKIEFKEPLARAQLVVTQSDASGAVTSRSGDLTAEAKFTSADPGIVTVSPTGGLQAVKNGQTQVAVTVGDTIRQVDVLITGFEPTAKIGFSEHVVPIFNKAGCNAGACHASQHGKGGFVLSVFGYAPDQDRAAIVRDQQQRRINFVEPEQSLFLLKPIMAVPHGGSRRLEKGSVDYQYLVQWIAAGAPGPQKEDPKVTSLTVFPTHRVGEIGFQQQLRVDAVYSNGTVRDVTHWAKFDSMDDSVLSVTSSGKLTAKGRGQAPAMVRFEGQAAISMVVVPFANSADLSQWTVNNYIDKFASDKFHELGITPSGLCDDATFLRRAFLDAIGTLPSPAEATAFIDSTDPDKRKKLVDRLLGLTGDPTQDIYNDQYAAVWSLKWSDLIRSNSSDLGAQGMWSLHNWIKSSFQANKPMDQFAKELVTAKGSIFSNGPANYYRLANNPPDLAETTAQLFLGVRLQCAKCHHHPFEKYAQDDYYSFAAFFSRVGNKGSQEFGLFGGETVVVVRNGGEVSNPRTGKIMKPTPLEGEPVDDPLDRRIALAKWLTSPENKMYARNVTNRYMGYLMGRGLVDPIDDMRATNPPSNPAMLDALADDFIKNGYNLKQLMRTIMTSRLYQLDSQPTASNATDRRFYSHFRVKRLTAEPLLDGIDLAAGTQTKFKDLPLGTRAIELPDAEYPDYFLNTFAKPKRASVCECERTPDENLSQALHTLNGDIIANKIADGKGRIAKLLEAKKLHDEIVTDLYLATLSRRPSAAELESSRTFLASSPTPKECYEDLLWALINSKQFLFVH